MREWSARPCRAARADGTLTMTGKEYDMNESTMTRTEPILRSLDALTGMEIRGKDERLGTLHDTLFDDVAWTARYFVVDTGNWLPGRRVLVSPWCCGEPQGPPNPAILASLTSDQVENAPGLEAARPVSRRHEIELATHYGWPTYWDGVVRAAPQVDNPTVAESGPLGDGHLRSAREVSGYAIEATDGSIGHVEDFVLEAPGWNVRYVVVDTRNWLPGRKVLVAPAWIADVDWGKQRVEVDLTRDQVRNSPEYDPSKPVNRRFEERLYDYYGRPYYW